MDGFFFFFSKRPQLLSKAPNVVRVSQGAQHPLAVPGSTDGFAPRAAHRGKLAGHQTLPRTAPPWLWSLGHPDLLLPLVGTFSTLPGDEGTALPP